MTLIAQGAARSAVASSACSICAAQSCTLDWTAASQSSAERSGRPARMPNVRSRPGSLRHPAGAEHRRNLRSARGHLNIGVGAGDPRSFATLLMMILAIDLRHRQVYLVMGYGGILLALLAAPMSMSGGLLSSAVGGLVAASAFGGLYMLGRAIYRGGEPLGIGDITIAALLGSMTASRRADGPAGGIFAGGIGAVLILTLGGSTQGIHAVRPGPLPRRPLGDARPVAGPLEQRRAGEACRRRGRGVPGPYIGIAINLLDSVRMTIATRRISRRLRN